jgi:hypothetical protein
MYRLIAYFLVLSEIRIQDSNAPALEDTTRLSAAVVIGIYLVAYVSQATGAGGSNAKHS